MEQFIIASQGVFYCIGKIEDFYVYSKVKLPEKCELHNKAIHVAKPRFLHYGKVRNKIIFFVLI